MRRLVAKSTVLLGAAILAGCSFSFSTGGSDTIDPDKVEDHLSKYLAGPDFGLRPDSVTCPEGIKPAQGATFECTAHIDGIQVPMEVTLTHVDLSTRDVDYSTRPAKPLLVAEKISKALKEDLQGEGPNASVDCGTERFRVVEVGGAMECTVTEGAKRVVIRVVAKDLDGNVEFEFAA
jgi:hypothetical protein